MERFGHPNGEGHADPQISQVHPNGGRGARDGIHYCEHRFHKLPSFVVITGISVITELTYNTGRNLAN
jgi:hypothetical protein